jgi:hypothetical protein
VKIGILLERRGVVVLDLGEMRAHQTFDQPSPVMATALRATAA